MSGFWRLMLFGKGPREAASPGRDLRIDVIRGLILLIIFVNHMPGNVVSGWMPYNFGFSDAADIFVLLAGISAAFAYGRLIDQRGLLVGSLKVGARIWTLYIAHLALFVLVCGIIATAIVRTQNSLYMEAINIQPFFSDTPAAIINALGLTYQPYYLDILPLYIVLLALFPLIYLAARTSPLPTLLVSLAVWQGATHLGLNLPNHPGEAGWFFNPFAWQLVFVFGVVLGRLALVGARVPKLVALDVVALGVVVFAATVKLSSSNFLAGVPLLGEWIDGLQIGIDKTNLAVARVIHLLALVWLVLRYLSPDAAMLRSRIGRGLAVIGRHSLEVFCTGIVLAIAGQIILAETSFVLWVQLLVNLTGITILAGLGMFLSWYKTLTARAAGAAREQPVAA
ncbi:OpgC family protein [Bosea sp. (in: a-proteobacteria)]|uniref:OpgC family protein n=1 Tax=Bosea sp. (in: a-proteobacteria) TaxID=1871050 RepID=UPI002FCA50C0